MKQLSYLFLIMLLILTSGNLYSQSLYLDKGQNATGIGVSFQHFDNFYTGIVSINRTFNGIIDVGLFSSFSDAGYSFGLSNEFIIIKESKSIPLTFSIHSSIYIISDNFSDLFVGPKTRKNKELFSISISMSKKLSLLESTAIYPTAFITYHNTFDPDPYYEANGMGVMLGIAQTIKNNKKLILEGSVLSSDGNRIVSIGLGFIF